MSQESAQKAHSKKSALFSRLVEPFKKAHAALIKWAYYDEDRHKGSLAGKVFTGTYALIFGTFVFYSCYAFRDILVPSNIGIWTYCLHYGPFLLTLASVGLCFVFFICLLFFESLSEIESTRWPINYGVYVFPTVFTLCNMWSEPYADLNRDWFDSDLRYPEFMSKSGFIISMTYFMLEMKLGFTSVDENISSIFLYRPWYREKSNDKQRIFYENFTGLLSFIFVFLSYWYFIFALSDHYYEKVAYYIGIYLLLNNFGRGYDFEKASKSLFAKLNFLLLLIGLQGYYVFQKWQSYGSDLVFVSRGAVVFLHFIIFVGWNSSQKSLLGSIFLPYKRKPGFEDFKFEVEVDEDIEDENKNKNINEHEHQHEEME